MNGFVDEGVDYGAEHPRPSGHAAGTAGQPVSACPWKPGTAEARDWTSAWIAATTDRRRDAGEFGATAADKAAAGLPGTASVRGGGWVDNIDPAFVSIGPTVAASAARTLFTAPVSGTYHLNAWVPPSGFSIDLTITLDADEADRLARRLGLPGWPISLAPEPEPDPKTRALARKRRPFTCHRHGQQPGGFCRTCQRGAR